MRRFEGVRIVNTYGPTECTVAVTSVEITQSMLDAQSPLPIGKPRPGTWLSLASQEGGYGEIVIHGNSVGKGYLGATPKQEARFIAPSSYLTGDWGRVDAAGHWFFHGRRDREIKLDGHRIDLNAVEAAIRDCPGVGDVIVAAPEDGARAGGLRAFILGSCSPEALSAIAAEAADRLAPSMMPRFWYGQNDCVFNASAKLDRRKLQADMLAAGACHIYTARAAIGAPKRGAA